jgi:hypothetical protein
MISAPFAHVGALPIEETLGSFGPALLVAVGVAWAQLRARLRGMRSRARADAAVEEGDVERPSGRRTIASGPQHT